MEHFFATYKQIQKKEVKIEGFGYKAEAIEAFRKQYWDRLWGYSARLGFTVKSDGTIE